MSHAPHRRLAAALLLSAGAGLAGCGGGAEPLDTPPRQAGAASTLLDDDGAPMPSDPAAVPTGTVPGPTRHATAAQAADLRRALGDRVRDVAPRCCGDDVEAAIAAATDPAEGVPLAVLLEGSDLESASAAAERLRAAGVDRVWVVAGR